MKRIRSLGRLGGPSGDDAADVSRALHPRVSLKPRTTSDFFALPELGDVMRQHVLAVDGVPLLRGSARRLHTVADALASLLEEGGAAVERPPVFEVLRGR